MNSTSNPIKVTEHMTEIVPNVFDTMLTLPVTSTAPGPIPTERVSGAVGIAGDQVNGTVYVHLPEPLARDVTRAMLQCTPGQDAGDSDVNDVVGELSNMIGCRLKSLLNDADLFCAISTPSVIRGAFAIDAPPDVCAEKFYFACLGQKFAVEVHLQILDVSSSSI